MKEKLLLAQQALFPTAILIGARGNLILGVLTLRWNGQRSHLDAERPHGEPQKFAHQSEPVSLHGLPVIFAAAPAKRVRLHEGPHG